MPLLGPDRGRRRVAGLPDRRQRRRRRSRVVVVVRGNDVHHRMSSDHDGGSEASATVREAARGRRRPHRVAAVERAGPVGQDRNVVVGDARRSSPSDGGIGQGQRRNQSGRFASGAGGG